MLSLLICGSFNKGEDNKLRSSPSSSSTPRKSRKNSFCKRQYKDTKNPYSSRGLDKFSALVADLEEQRQRIYSQLGSDDMYTVRFAYSNANEIKPIVIKLRDKEKDKITHITESKVNLHDHSKTSSGILDSKTPTEPQIKTVKDVKQDETISSKKNNKKFSWNNSFRCWSRPNHYYMPIVFIIMILMFLAAFGRSTAILCTTIAWYMIPTLQESSQVRLSMNKRDSSQVRLSMNKRDSSQVRLSMNKKDYVRRLSERTMAYDGLTSPRKSTCTEAAVKDNFP